jgi:hypothetical protein
MRYVTASASALCVVTAMVLASSCSLVNAPDDVIPGDTPGAGTGGTGGDGTGGDGAGGSGGGPACTGTLRDCDDNTQNGCETDVAIDAANCGACDAPCGLGAQCVNSACACGAGQELCDDACVDTSTDPDHCGDCTTACGACNVCQDSACAPAPPLGSPGAITTQGVTCQFNPAGFSIAPVAGATSYTWTVPQDAFINSGQGTEAIAVSFGSSNGQVCVSASNECSTSAPTCIDVNLGVLQSGSQAFSFSGGEQLFTVPQCVTQMLVDVYGAQGGGSACCTGMEEDGGLGGYATGVIPVTPGETLHVYVGSKGIMGGPGGFNGGGLAGQYGGGGGGASDIRRGATLADRIFVAGAGGGGNCGCPDHGMGGPGGGLDGGAGISLQGYLAPGGGSQVAGGSAGEMSMAGDLGLGGGLGGYHEAGGGGGYYGGGGAFASGAGGGSCYFGTAINPSTSPGVRAGDGLVVMFW